MKKLALLIALSFLTTACQTMEGIGDDISNIKMPTTQPKGLEAPTNPNDSDKINGYKEPEAPATAETEVDIKRDFPAYHTSPRFDNEAATK